LIEVRFIGAPYSSPMTIALDAGARVSGLKAVPALVSHVVGEGLFEGVGPGR
jgi:hypothetical protein